MPFFGFDFNGILPNRIAIVVCPDNVELQNVSWSTLRDTCFNEYSPADEVRCHKVF
jgi:hypothetical protein